MGRIIIAILAIVLISGCGSNPPKVEYKYVSKPVLVCPPPADMNNGEMVPTRPKLAIFELTADSTDGEVARAYEITIKQLQGHTEVLQEIIDGYDKTSREYEKIKAVMDALYPDGGSARPQQ